MRQRYRFEKSSLDDFHRYIVFFFESIYFQSKVNSTDWSESLLHSRLKPFLRECPKFRQAFESIHSIYINKDLEEKRAVFESARNSLDIHSVCHSVSSINHRNDFSEDLGKAIHFLFNYIYYELPKTKIFRNEYGKLIDHYNKIKENNPKIKNCPFCGLHPIKAINSSKKQTYDHYLPLSHYPFVGFNTENLVPTCKDCNEDYKGYKDVLYKDSQRTKRRKLIFPYGTYNYTPEITIKVFNFDPGSLKINQCLVLVGNEENIYEDEMRSWNEIYELDERYKKIIINDSDTWYSEFLEFASQQEMEGRMDTMENHLKTYLNAIGIQEASSNVILKRPYFKSMDNLTNVFSDN